MRVMASPSTLIDLAPVLIVRDGTVAAIRSASPTDRAPSGRSFTSSRPSRDIGGFFSSSEPADNVIGGFAVDERDGCQRIATALLERLAALAHAAGSSASWPASWITRPDCCRRSRARGHFFGRVLGPSESLW